MNGAGHHGRRRHGARREGPRKPRPKPAETPLQASCASTSQCARGAELLRVHCARPRRSHRLFIAVVPGARPREPMEVTRPVLERYQRHLFHYRKTNGEPLSFRTQHARLVPLRDVVPLDDPAELHPAQPGVGAGAAAARPARCRRTSSRPRRSSDDDAAATSRTPSACATGRSWRCSTRPASGAWR